MNRQLLEFLGNRPKPLVIAELCTNAHPYDDATLEKFIALADLAGCAGVKLQYWRADHFPLGERDRKRPYELPDGVLSRFVYLAHEFDLLAGASVFEAGDVDKLCAAGVDFIKLAAREVDNRVLLDTAVGTRRPVLRSLPYFGAALPGTAFDPRVLSFYCTPHYPAEASLMDMVALRHATTPWGWSSHTGDGMDCVVAAALGAAVVEAHLKTSDVEPEALWSLSERDMGFVVKLCETAAGRRRS